MSTYPMLDFTEYLVKVLTYRPAQLGYVELDILDIYAKNKSNSVYQIFKELKELRRFGTEKEIAYNNIHKRVKRLAELQLIEELEEHFERGAKHYKITLYGLISYLNQKERTSTDFFIKNKDSILIRSLLLQFFEEETIHSLRFRPDEFPAPRIYEYLRSCCYDTAVVCKVWTYLERYEYELPSLPSDKVIQQYMLYLGGKQIADQRSMLHEIKEYERRLQRKLEIHGLVVKNIEQMYSELPALDQESRTDPEKRDFREAPYPLGVVYDNILNTLRSRLEENIRMLAFNIVSRLGHILNSRTYSEDDLRRELDKDKDSSVRHILTDRKFIKLVESVRNDFDIGTRQFIYYHKLGVKKKVEELKDTLPTRTEGRKQVSKI